MHSNEKILLICSHNPFSGVGGDKAATKHIVHSFSKCLEVIIVCFGEKTEILKISHNIMIYSLKYPKKITRIFNAVINIKKLGLGFGSFWFKPFKSLISDIILEHNITQAVAHHPYMCPYLHHAEIKHKYCEVHVLDSEVYFKSWKKNQFRLKNIFIYFDLKRAENYFLNKNKINFFLSEIETKKYETNGIYSPLPLKVENLKPGIKFSDRDDTLLFFGDFAWLPNLTTVGEIIKLAPILEKSHPQFKILLIGAHLPKPIQGVLKKYSNISYLGYIDDLKNIKEKSKYLLAPMTIGGGVRLKILEAIQSGIIILTNKEGCEGLPSKNPCFRIDKDIPINQLLNKIELMSDQVKQEIVNDGTKMILDHFSADKRLVILKGKK